MALPQRQEIEHELEHLYGARGAAMLDGKKFDDAKITKAEAQLRAIDDAENERVRREREKTARIVQAENERKLKLIVRKENERQTAWAHAQVAAQNLAMAISQIIKATDAERTIWGELGVFVPHELGPHTNRMRLSLRIANKLAKVTECGAQIGSAIHLRGVGGLFSGDEDWKDEEMKLLGIPIAALKANIEGGRHDDSDEDKS